MIVSSKISLKELFGHALKMLQCFIWQKFPYHGNMSTTCPEEVTGESCVFFFLGGVLFLTSSQGGAFFCARIELKCELPFWNTPQQVIFYHVISLKPRSYNQEAQFDTGKIEMRYKVLPVYNKLTLENLFVKKSFFSSFSANQSDSLLKIDFTRSKNVYSSST